MFGGRLARGRRIIIRKVVFFFFDFLRRGRSSLSVDHSLKNRDEGKRLSLPSSFFLFITRSLSALSLLELAESLPSRQPWCVFPRRSLRRERRNKRTKMFFFLLSEDPSMPLSYLPFPFFLLTSFFSFTTVSLCPHPSLPQTVVRGLVQAGKREEKERERERENEKEKEENGLLLERMLLLFAFFSFPFNLNLNLFSSASLSLQHPTTPQSQPPHSSPSSRGPTSPSASLPPRPAPWIQ